MRAAMAAAEVGDDGYGEDPTVNRLETLAAALLGKEAALYVPSGTMANTHMPAGGRPWRAAEVSAVATAARASGVPVHCDGARIWNAAIALGVAPAALVAPVETVMFCLSKGLAAPVGSLLCGPREL